MPPRVCRILNIFEQYRWMHGKSKEVLIAKFVNVLIVEGSSGGLFMQRMKQKERELWSHYSPLRPGKDFTPTTWKTLTSTSFLALSFVCL